MAGTAAATQTFHRSKGVVSCKVALACDASGVVPALVIGDFYGKVEAVYYDGGLDASAVVTFADFGTGATLFTITTGTEGTPVTYKPTTAIVDTAGTTVTVAAGVNTDVNRAIKVAGKVTIAVASGGVSETGTFKLVIDEAGLGVQKGK